MQMTNLFLMYPKKLSAQWILPLSHLANTGTLSLSNHAKIRDYYEAGKQVCMLALRVAFSQITADVEVDALCDIKKYTNPNSWSTYSPCDIPVCRVVVWCSMLLNCGFHLWLTCLLLGLWSIHLRLSRRFNVLNNIVLLQTIHWLTSFRFIQSNDYLLGTIPVEIVPEKRLLEADLEQSLLKGSVRKQNL